jgi:hypothetical protein
LACDDGGSVDVICSVGDVERTLVEAQQICSDKGPIL